MKFWEGNLTIFCGCLVWITFYKKTLFNSESVFDDKKGYEMLSMKIFQKNIQTVDLFPLEPEVPK